MGHRQRSTKKLQALGLATVADLAAYDVTRGREVLTVTSARVIWSCKASHAPAAVADLTATQGLAVTRTFGESVTEWHELAQAVSAFA